MGKFAAIVNLAYVFAGLALFATGEAPVITPSTDFLGNAWAKAWAGWKFSGCLYMVLVNAEAPLGVASAVTMVPYIAFDVFAAAYHPEHWTSLAFSFVVLELVTAAAALSGNLKVGGFINALYTLAGVALFVTGEAPVVNHAVDFHKDTFAMAWAGWKFAGCFFFAMVNLGAHSGLATALAMIPYVAFDVYALQDSAHWTTLAGGFIVLDGIIGVLGMQAWLAGAAPAPKGKAA